MTKVKYDANYGIYSNLVVFRFVLFNIYYGLDVGNLRGGGVGYTDMCEALYTRISDN